MWGCGQCKCRTRSVTHFSSPSNDSRMRNRVWSARALSVSAHWSTVSMVPVAARFINSSLRQVNRSQAPHSRVRRLDSKWRNVAGTLEPPAPPPFWSRPPEALPGDRYGDRRPQLP